MSLFKKTLPACLVIAVTAVLLPAGANAQGGARGSIPSLAFDANDDGLISKKEFDYVFFEFDTNGDGQLDRQEIIAGRKALMDKRFERQVQQHRALRKDRMGGMMPVFEDFDLDGDGKITESEFSKAHEKRMAMMQERGYPMMHMAERPTFASIDSNGDSAIDRAEFRKHQDEHHRKMRKQRDMMWQQRMEESRNKANDSDWQPWNKP